MEPNDEQEISLVDLIKQIQQWFRYLLSQWKIIFLLGILGGATGFYYAWKSPITYTAKMIFVVEEAKSSGGGLAALAGQFGFDVGGGSSNLVSGDNIIGLLTSRSMVESALVSPFELGGKQSLADRYATVNEFQKAWSEKYKKDISFPIEKMGGFSRVQDSLLQQIEEGIIKNELKVVRKDKKMSFIEVSTTMKDEQLAALFTKHVVHAAVDFYIETKTRRSRANVERLQKRADSIGGLLNIQTYATADLQSKSLDINPAFGSAGVNREISARDKTMLATIYAEVVKNLEIQKATLTQETPVIQVVDDIQMPLMKNKTGKLKSMILGGLLSGFLTILFLLGRRWWKGLNPN
ncbi:MAG: lipopolysaccharide biosynthesis protein [Chitinophagaceae bacterium]|nr:MAG: lipopolysaccharide biosynthesis protein [Chitinophagaceae bacterium]